MTWFSPVAVVAETMPSEVIVRTIERDVTRGQLIRLSRSDGLTLRLEDGEEKVIPIADVVRISVPAASSASKTADMTLTLVGGDTIRGRVCDVGERTDVVGVETADLGRLSVPLDAVASLDLAASNSSAQRAAMERLDRARDMTDDRLLLSNGDILHGFVAAVDAEGVSLEVGVGKTALPWNRVTAIRFTGGKPEHLDGPSLTVSLRESGRITAIDLDWSGRVVDARLKSGERVSFDADRVVAIDVQGGRWEWIGEHQPISYEHTPMIALAWEYMVDRNVLNGPLVVAGERFERGIGVHSRSKLAYDLQGKYREFVTSLGMDDDSGALADASVFIVVDGKRRLDQPHVRPGALLGPFRIDVAHAERLELMVDFGANGDVQDRLDWIEAALIR